MKQERLGPFIAVRWFCRDGTILPPEPYACRPHGGGRQHGQRGEVAERLRAEGIPLANVLAELRPETALQDNAERLKALLIEQHLMALDDGWIFRRARYVRGIFQVESDTAAAQAILQAMLRDQRYLERDFLLLREAARRIGGNADENLLDRVRNTASGLAARDSGFASLRNKIHSFPDAQDAAAVRKYASGVGEPLQGDAIKLAADIEALYQSRALGPALSALAQHSGGKFTGALALRWEQARSSREQLDVAADVLMLVRDRLGDYAPQLRISALQLSLAAEEAVFIAGRDIAASGTSGTALSRLAILDPLLRGLYGTGLLSGRERDATRQILSSLSDNPRLSLQGYRKALSGLARPPVWAANRLSFYFGDTVRAFGRVETKAEHLLPDRLRAAPTLIYGEVLESLAAQSDKLAGIRHEFFGRALTGGLRALNAGLARGPLQALAKLESSTSVPAIVVAPESAADLPAVAGILTAAEGNALSHVQLLARNLGVPNVVVAPERLDDLSRHYGQTVVLAASPAGVVRLDRDGPQWAALFPARAEPVLSITVDLARLNLAVWQPTPMSELRAVDSGRTVGPKAAKLGELWARYPAQVSPGVAIPFGAFRKMLDAPGPTAELSTLDWMRTQYEQLRALSDEQERQRQTREFLTRLRGHIESYQFESAFRESLLGQLQAVFGPEGSFGVFVRSDTNVEDLPGFTGAGLNLTVPNVVGAARILDAVRQVWASPFTERAYGWRQALMDQPEHLYVAVLLHRTVPADKSGVMITADLESNDPGWVTVATNEGVGGGVEGQAAESLRIRLDDGRVELLASATEPKQRRVLAKGGSVLEPAMAPEYLLQPNEIQALLIAARSLPDKYPQLLDAQGRRAPADVEFAFSEGRLYLNQIRPFLQSDRARSNTFLLSLDAQLKATADREIDLRVLQ